MKDLYMVCADGSMVPSGLRLSSKNKVSGPLERVVEGAIPLGMAYYLPVLQSYMITMVVFDDDTGSKTQQFGLVWAPFERFDRAVLKSTSKLSGRAMTRLTCADYYYPRMKGFWDKYETALMSWHPEKRIMVMLDHLQSDVEQRLVFSRRSLFDRVMDGGKLDSIELLSELVIFPDSSQIDFTPEGPVHASVLEDRLEGLEQMGMRTMSVYEREGTLDYYEGNA